MPTPHAYLKGKILPLEEAKISILCHGFNYGTGCFEGIRGYWNEKKEELYLLHLDAHLRRLKQSGKILFMDMPIEPAELSEVIKELVRTCDYRQNIYVRPTLFKDDEVMGVRLHNLTDALSVYAIPMGKYVDTEAGLKVGFSSWRRIDDNMIPARAKVTGAYINSALAKTEAHYNGFDEAIFLNQNGHVSEGSAENLFLIRDGVLVTPMTTDNILEGITRASIITLAEKELGLKVVSRSIDRTELYVADELFLCGTGAQIAWVKEIDHRKIGNGHKGELTAQLDKLYLEAVHGENAKYSSWISPVYEKSLVNS